MDATLGRLFLEAVSSNLKQKSLTLCSKWSCANRIMGQPFPGPFSFKYHPWLKEIHDTDTRLLVCKKAAQVGFTEAALNKTFFKIAVERIDVLYVLPVQHPDASDFSSSRFDAALDLSSTLTNLFSDTRNVGHKRAGSCNLFIRGSQSRSALKSIPVGFIVFDELDEMCEENIPLARERAAGQRSCQEMMLSTPTSENFGIDAWWANTTQESFFFACPSCNKQINLEFPRNLEITAERSTDIRINDTRLFCHHCNATLHHEDKPNFLAKGKFVPEYADRESRGFHVNQLYSSAQAGIPKNLAIAYLDSRLNPAKEQEFYNSKLGKTHAVAGAKVTDTDIEQCIGSHSIGPVTYSTLITMGIDVGLWLHFTIKEWFMPTSTIHTFDINAIAEAKTLCISKVEDYEQLSQFFRRYNVTYGVIDAQPDRRASYDFACRFPGRVSMCFYGTSSMGKQISKNEGQYGEPLVTVDRTSWLDVTMGRIKTRRVALPRDTPQEYKSHIKSLVRVPKIDKNGNTIYQYQHSGDDHYAHADNYSEIALQLAIDSGVPGSITKKVH